MKAIIYDKSHKDLLKLQEVEKTAPKENEVLIKIHSVSVNAADVRSMKMGIIPKNKIFGSDIAGVVEAVGINVKKFFIGDEVVGDLSAHGFGGFAEYVTVVESALVLKPKSLSFETASAIPMSSVTALQALRNKGNIQPGQKVLICGAGGGVGTFAVQLAKHFQAEVTAVCGKSNVAIMKDLNVDHIINYNEKNFTQSNKQYDLILAVNGNYSLSDYKSALTSKGTVVIVGGSLSQLIKSIFFGKFVFPGNKKLRVLSAKPNHADLQFILNLVTAGRIRPIIDRSYSLEQTGEAVKYVMEGHAKGKVVINVAESTKL
ncbi:MAG: NAD(P)-dependent alcohol dehydrogenase [Erysipelotrichaceae bacterium]|nr:NAD(P)-dependent alcohol dehydrogenase [Erysipelotrichaceae bacterium]